MSKEHPQAVSSISSPKPPKVVTDPQQIVPLRTQSGQKIEDIVISFDAPADVQHMIRFYLESEPDKSQLCLGLNQRATFRWVAKDGAEIKVGSEDRLLWEVLSSKWTIDGQPVDLGDDGPIRRTPPSVWMKGTDIRTKRYILNQSEYEIEE